MISNIIRVCVCLCRVVGLSCQDSLKAFHTLNNVLQSFIIEDPLTTLTANGARALHFFKTTTTVSNAFTLVREDANVNVIVVHNTMILVVAVDFRRFPSDLT